MPEHSFRMYVDGMKAAGKEFDRLVTERLTAESEAEESAKEAERLAREQQKNLDRARRRGS